MKMYWRWGKCLTNQGNKTISMKDYACLLKDSHWEIIEKTLREANAKKNGCHNMVLYIQTEFKTQSTDSDDDNQHEVIPLNVSY